MSSATSAILNQITTFRNFPISRDSSPPMYKIALAEAAYITIIPFVLIEAAIAQVIRVIAQYLPIDNQRYQAIHSWAANSADCVSWILRTIAGNLFTKHITLMHPITTPGVRRVPFSSQDVSESLPVKLLDPPSVEPAVAALLKNYELGDNAKRCSDTLKTLYQNLPTPTSEELNQIGEQVATLLADRCNAEKTDYIKTDLNSIAQKRDRNEWEDRYIKMVISLRKTIMGKNDPSEIEILKTGFEEAYANCSNRKSMEMERLYFTFVAPDLNRDFLDGLSPTDSLMLELMLHRMTLRDTIINTLCNDRHNAASHNYFQRKCNASIFYLPSVSLSATDLAFEGYAMKEKEADIINAFRHAYHAPEAIFALFTSLLYPAQGKAFKFKADMFVEWLNSTNRKDLNAFEDDSMTKYKPQLVIEYLESLGFLKRKTG